MKSICAIFFSLMCSCTNAQTIHINQFDLDFTSYLPKSEQLFIDSVLNGHVFTISLVSLKPICSSPGNCYPASAIIEDIDNIEIDSTFFVSVPLLDVQSSLFDSIVPLDISDYGLVLTEILMGEAPYNETELINMCYNPRHAIIVQDEAEKILGIYELCFECGKSKVAFSSVVTINDSGPYKLFSKYGLISPR